MFWEMLGNFHQGPHGKSGRSKLQTAGQELMLVLQDEMPHGILDVL